MKKFIFQFLGFFLIFSILSFVTGKFLLPQKIYWGNQMYQCKVNDVTADTSKYDIAFFGSSRIATGIRPALFDSIINSSYPSKIKSYNFATFGTWFSENDYLFNHFIHDSLLHKKIKYVVMEFQNVMSIKWDKISTNKVTYYQNTDNLSFIYKYSKEKGSTSIFKYMPFYLIAYYENLLNLGKSEVLFYDTTYKKEYGEQGFAKVKENPEKLKVDIDNMYKSIKTYQNTDSSYAGKLLLQKAKNLILELKNENIKLIWILPPVKVTKEFMAAFQAIPEENKINLINTDYYPFFYDKELWNDNIHFNLKGADLLTTTAAKLFLKKIQND